MTALVELCIIGLVALLSLAFIVTGVTATNQQSKLDRRLRDIRATAPVDALDGWRRLAAAANNLTLPGTDQEEIQRGLRAAGYYHPDAVPVFGAVRLGASIFAAMAAAAVVSLMHGWGGLTRVIPMLAAGAVLIMAKPVLSGLAADRSRKINAEMPFTLDVLLMMLESGVSLDQFFRTFAQSEGRAAPRVRVTVVALVEDLQRGMAYDMALQRWSDRLGVTGARELAAVFRQSLSHGSELSVALRQFSEEFSDMRVATARESIGKKTVRMTLIMVLFFMPALFIVLAGPAVTTLSAALKSMH